MDDRFEVKEADEGNNARLSDNGPTMLTSGGSLNVTGTWSGAASDSSGPGSLILNLTQTGQAVSGPVRGLDVLSRATFNGTLSGTLAGATLAFTIRIPKGGVVAFPNCGITIQASSQIVAGTLMTGSYTGTNSCTGPISNGQFILEKE